MRCTTVPRLSDDEFKALSAHYDDAKIFEIMLLCGFYRTVSYLANGLELPLEEKAARFPEVTEFVIPRRAQRRSPSMIVRGSNGGHRFASPHADEVDVARAYATPARRKSCRWTMPTGFLASVTISVVIFDELSISSASLASRSRPMVFGIPGHDVVDQSGHQVGRACGGANRRR